VTGFEPSENDPQNKRQDRDILPPIDLQKKFVLYGSNYEIVENLAISFIFPVPADRLALISLLLPTAVEIPLTANPKGHIHKLFKRFSRTSGFGING